ncbi:MAG TPA: hypothetical protein VGG30_01400, partial [Pirellulales bacterium]
MTSTAGYFNRRERAPAAAPFGSPDRCILAIRQLLEALPGGCKVRIDFQRQAIMRHGVVDVTLRGKRVSQIAMCLGMIGGGGHCHLKQGNRLVDFALLDQFGAAAVLGFGCAAAGSFSLLVDVVCLACFSLPAKNPSQVLIEINRVRIEFDCAAEMNDCFVGVSISLGKQHGEVGVRSTRVGINFQSFAEIR